jgi:hypothetical protein
MFEIKSAVRVNTPAFIALAGPSGSGKTRSALELATGLAGDGKILLADTEGNRGLHYADLYKFDHVEFTPPYTPERCAELIELAEARGYAVLIVDSGSDEYEGNGGLQEIRDTTKDEFWAKTKARHKHALINRIRRSRIHSIWCLRCEERVKISKVNGQTVVETLGWQPICEKRFLYEMQSSFRFDPERPGVPVPIKLYDIHAKFFANGAMVNRDAGRQLAAWAAGGAIPAVEPSDFLKIAQAKAGEGTDAFREWWKTLSKWNRDFLRDDLANLQGRAEKADEWPDTEQTQPDAQAEPAEEGSPPAPSSAGLQNPERAAVIDPKPKPSSRTTEEAGSFSETNARQSGPAAGRRSGARGGDDVQRRASAAEGDGSSPPIIVEFRHDLVGEAMHEATCDDLIAAFETLPTLVEMNQFLKANSQTIQALSDEADERWREASAERMREKANG